MLCGNCKKEVKEGAAFCPYCGSKIEDISTEEVISPIPEYTPVYTPSYESTYNPDDTPSEATVVTSDEEELSLLKDAAKKSVLKAFLVLFTVIIAAASAFYILKPPSTSENQSPSVNVEQGSEPISNLQGVTENKKNENAEDKQEAAETQENSDTGIKTEKEEKQEKDNLFLNIVLGVVIAAFALAIFRMLVIRFKKSKKDAEEKRINKCVTQKTKVIADNSEKTVSPVVTADISVTKPVIPVKAGPSATVTVAPVPAETSAAEPVVSVPAELSAAETMDPAALLHSEYKVVATSEKADTAEPEVSIDSTKAESVSSEEENKQESKEEANPWFSPAKDL